MPVNKTANELLRSPQNIVYGCKMNEKLSSLVKARAKKLGVSHQEVIRQALIIHLGSAESYKQYDQTPTGKVPVGV